MHSLKCILVWLRVLGIFDREGSKSRCVLKKKSRVPTRFRLPLLLLYSDTIYNLDFSQFGYCGYALNRIPPEHRYKVFPGFVTFFPQSISTNADQEALFSPIMRVPATFQPSLLLMRRVLQCLKSLTSSIFLLLYPVVLVIHRPVWGNAPCLFL